MIGDGPGNSADRSALVWSVREAVGGGGVHPGQEVDKERTRQFPSSWREVFLLISVSEPGTKATGLGLGVCCQVVEGPQSSGRNPPSQPWAAQPPAFGAWVLVVQEGLVDQGWGVGL